MGTYRKKPVEIQAVQVGASSHTLQELAQLCGGTVDGDYICIPTLEGTMVAAPGDWIIRGVKGEFYPCKPDIFEATYDEVLPDDWISRVQAERNQLSDRLAKLRYFFGTIAFNDLSITSQGLLQAQADVMGAYLAILDVRLARAAGCE